MNRNDLRAILGTALLFGLLATVGWAQSPFIPDTTLTPGATRVVTAKAVCVPGSSKAVRNVPTSEKNAAYKEYGILKRAPGSYEIDHDISLELGGSNEIGNLWPEQFDINVGGLNEGAHTKDALENKLHSLVCSGKLTLKQAQDAIRGDWRPAYLKYVAPKFPPYRATPASGKKAPVRPTSRNDVGAPRLFLASESILAPSPSHTSVGLEIRLVRSTADFDSARFWSPNGNSISRTLDRCRPGQAYERDWAGAPCLRGTAGIRTSASRPRFHDRRISGSCGSSDRSNAGAFQPRSRTRDSCSADASQLGRSDSGQRVRSFVQASHKIASQARFGSPDKPASLPGNFTFAMQRDTVTGPYMLVGECVDMLTLSYLSGQSKEVQAEFKRLNPELYAGAVRANNKIIEERQK